MSDLKKDIQACVGVMIWKNDKVLLGKRRGKHASGEYSFPSGRIEYMEGFEDAAKRETEEESGIKIKNLKFLNVSNINRYNYRHDVLISFTADWESGEEKDTKEERIGEWEWYHLDNLPEPLFYPTKILIDAYRTKEFYYDKK